MCYIGANIKNYARFDNIKIISIISLFDNIFFWFNLLLKHGIKNFIHLQWTVKSMHAHNILVWIKRTCSLSSALKSKIFFTESQRRDRCSSVFGNIALAPSSSSASFSGSYVSAKTDFRLIANRFTIGSERKMFDTHSKAGCK